MQKILRKEKPSADKQHHASDLRSTLNWLRAQGDLIETDKPVDPDLEVTGLQKHMSREQQMALGWFDEAGKLNDRFKNTEQGAATSIWAAVAPELEGVGGRYLEDCAIAAPWTEERPMNGYMPYALDPARAERLWAVSEELIGG